MAQFHDQIIKESKNFLSSYEEFNVNLNQEFFYPPFFLVDIARGAVGRRIPSIGR